MKPLPRKSSWYGAFLRSATWPCIGVLHLSFKTCSCAALWQAQRLYDDFKRFAPGAENTAPASAAGVAAAAVLGADEDVDPESPAEVRFRAAQGLTGPATKGFLNQNVLGAVPLIGKEAGAQSESEGQASAAATVEPATMIRSSGGTLQDAEASNGNSAPAAPASSDTGADFQPAAAFGGSRPGFCFRSGDKGLGYYRDGDGACGPEIVAAGDADIDAATHQIEQMHLAAAPIADVTMARKPRSRSEKEDIPDALNDSDDDSDFGDDHASDAARNDGAGSDSDDDLPEPGWRQQHSSATALPTQKPEASPMASAMQASPSSVGAPPKLPAPQERKPAASLAAGLDSRTASIMAQLLNRGTASWGDPVVSSDDEDMGDARNGDKDDVDQGDVVLVPSVGSVSKSIAAKVEANVRVAGANVTDKAKTKKKKKTRKKGKDAKAEGKKKKTKKATEFAGFGMSAAKVPKLTKAPKSGRAFEVRCIDHAAAWREHARFFVCGEGCCSNWSTSFFFLFILPL